jgi:porphobilinogen synthase
LLFGVPAVKRETGFLAEFTASQLTAIKKRFGSAVTLAVDVCLCSHTLSGACGYLDSVHGIQNEKTVQTLLEFSLAYATAGADILAPSDMMDGRVAAIRQMLNAHGFHQTSILSYSAKFHSRFYGPFREAAESAPKGSWDRADHQIDPRNGEDAIRCTLRDVEEGADMVMVKPGLPYLDIVYRLTQEIAVPCAVYQVSGESAALEAIANGDENCRKHLYLETWTAFHRAGARFVISYAAKEGQRWLRET